MPAFLWFLNVLNQKSKKELNNPTNVSLEIYCCNINIRPARSCRTAKICIIASVGRQKLKNSKFIALLVSDTWVFGQIPSRLSGFAT